MAEAVKESNIQDVIAEQEKIVAEKPDNVMAHHMLGLIYLRAGRSEDAIRELEKAIEIDSQSMDE